MTEVTITQQVVQVRVIPASGPILTVHVPAAAQVRVVPSGMRGPPGPVGQGVQTDPGDFTLIFENQLI